MLTTVITVDGLAGSGKTSLSHELARRLSWCHFNSGQLYRAVGWLALECGSNVDDESAVVSALASHKLQISVSPHEPTVILVDEQPLTADLSNAAISDATSRASRHGEVRKALIDIQRGVVRGGSVIAEGRDMGTVIFPDAVLKFWITASEAVRAERRLAQWHADKTCTQARREQMKADLMREITERDQRDASRAVAPSVPAVDAVLVDNSAGSLTETCETMYCLALSRGITPG